MGIVPEEMFKHPRPTLPQPAGLLPESGGLTTPDNLSSAKAPPE